jgi:hypothetical protein
MKRLRRFYEKVPFSQTSSRVAYATSTAALSKSLPGGEWAEDTKFNAGDYSCRSHAEGRLQGGASQRLRYCERAMTDPRFKERTERRYCSHQSRSRGAVVRTACARRIRQLPC